MLPFNALVTLNGVKLTDQGRAPISIEREERSVEVELANGNIRKYVKGIKRTFALAWTWLPDDDSQTIDGYAARLTIKQMFGDSPNLLELMLEDEDGMVTSYDVFVTGYSETLIRRSSQGFFWDVTLELKEQ